MRWLALLILLPALLGCTEDKNRAVAQCWLDAQKTYPGENPEKSDKIDVFVMNCMRAAGYQDNLLADECKADPKLISPFLQPGCYRSDTWLARAWRYETEKKRPNSN